MWHCDHEEKPEETVDSNHRSLIERKDKMLLRRFREVFVQKFAVQANFLGTLQRSKFAFAPKTLSFTAFYFVKAGFDGASMHRAS